MSALSKVIPCYLSICILILFFSIICSYYFARFEMSHIVICDSWSLSGSCSKTCPIAACPHSSGADYVWRIKLNTTISSVAISHWNCFTTLFIPCTLSAYLIDLFSNLSYWHCTQGSSSKLFLCWCENLTKSSCEESWSEELIFSLGLFFFIHLFNVLIISTGL